MTDEARPQTDERKLQGPRLEVLVRERWIAPGGVRALAQTMGLSRATLYSWFRGDTAPDTHQLTLLARVLHTSPSELMAAMAGPDETAALDAHISAVATRAARDAVSFDRDALESPRAMAMREWAMAPPPAAARPPGKHFLQRSRGPSAPPERRVLEVIGPQEVVWCDAGDPIGPVARRMYEGSFSQVPVRDRGTWTALLTTDTIARWTAARSARGLGYDETTPVREVLPYAEDPDNFRVVGADATVEAVVAVFDAFAAEGQALDVLVTPNGKPHGELRGIVTSADLPRIRSAT